MTQNGDACFWHITGEDPETWTVVVDAARDPAWERFDMSTTSFLYGVLSGSVAVEALPADFPSGNPAFREIAQ
ncbi:hypothetical protein ACF3NT_04200 [Naumannella halotolerans]|uniref:hypothetical protein n=1 Tax=Naumannella halotolerans TaxID=993414 RepID=UPI00370DBFF8